MRKSVWGFIFGVTAACVVLYACSKSGGSSGEPDPNDPFKAAMLANYADNLIIPAYTDLQEKLVALDDALDVFLAAPSLSTQADLKITFKAAYLSFENVSFAYFGPAMSKLLNNYLNTFPAVIDDIEQNIQTGSYNLNAPISSDSVQGFPALDYLLFSSDAITELTAVDAADRKSYVQELIERMRSLVDNVLTQWQTTYRAAFIANTKLNVGSSMGYMINQFAFEMDRLKGPRIGWPFGKQSGGIVFADKCEGYFSGFSRELAVANLTCLKNYYNGGSGSGLDDYLILINRSQLNSDVLAQFEVALTALNAIPDPMSGAFTNNATLVNTAYGQVQLLLTLLKTDVASATGVRINYQDSDGD